MSLTPKQKEVVNCASVALMPLMDNNPTYLSALLQISRHRNIAQFGSETFSGLEQVLPASAAEIIATKAKLDTQDEFLEALSWRVLAADDVNVYSRLTDALGRGFAYALELAEGDLSATSSARLTAACREQRSLALNCRANCPTELRETIENGVKCLDAAIALAASKEPLTAIEALRQVSRGK